MDFVTDNWVWLLLLGGFLTMHLFMHRGHGGHGGCGAHGGQHGHGDRQRGPKA